MVAANAPGHAGPNLRSQQQCKRATELEKIQTELRGTVMKVTYSCILLLASALCAGASAQAGERDRDQGLVLGDSVAFAYIASAGHAYVNPENFLGFWNELGRWRGVEVTDA